MRHLRECQRHFGSDGCHVFVHTWDTLRQSTDSWSLGHRGAGVSSAACVDKLRTLLRPQRLIVQQQQLSHQNASLAQQLLAPDGFPFHRSQLRWGPSRYVGWLMNVRGMLEAARLRERFALSYAMSVRLRPDGKEVAFRKLSGIERRLLWDCIALAVDPGARALVWKRASGEAQVWAASAAQTLSPCAPYGELGWSYGSYANDNCFMGGPDMMDRVLHTLVHNHTLVYTQSKALGLYLPHPEVQLPVAAAIAGVATRQTCHRDVLRYISHQRTIRSKRTVLQESD